MTGEVELITSLFSPLVIAYVSNTALTKVLHDRYRLDLSQHLQPQQQQPYTHISSLFYCKHAFEEVYLRLPLVGGTELPWQQGTSHPSNAIIRIITTTSSPICAS